MKCNWLPVKYRIKYKVAKIAFLVRSSTSTVYLNSSVSKHKPHRSLRSDNSYLLTVPYSSHVIGSRAFRVAAPTVFNSFPLELRSSDNLHSFCSQLKKLFQNRLQSTIETCIRASDSIVYNGQLCAL